MFDIMFTIVPIFIFVVFIITIATIISPKLRGKMMSNQIKAMKHMTEFSKEDFQEINKNMAEANIKAREYIVNEYEDTLKETSTKEAEIKKDAITITTKSIMDGINNNKKYCKYCGAKIDNDSLYCKKCGKKQ